MSYTESSMRQMREEAWIRENLVDQHAAAKMIGIDLRTLRRWHRQGFGPKRFFPVRKRPIYYSKVEVEQFAATYDSGSAGSHLQTDISKVDHEHTTANGHSKVDHEHTTANGHFRSVST
jgi:hypothetical protein